MNYILLFPTYLRRAITQKGIIALIVCCGICCSCSLENSSNTGSELNESLEKDSLFLNPIHTSGPDPWVFQTEDAYYLTFTTGVNLTLYKSDHMSSLTNAQVKVVWTPPESGPNSKDIWAPEIHRVEDSWYIYYAADGGDNQDHRMFVIQNNHENPLQGEWEDMGQLDLPDDKWAIDGTIFKHKEELYFLWSGWDGDVNVMQSIYICKMKDPLTPTGDRVLLTSPEFDWETNGVNPMVAEGPQVLVHEDHLFLIYSAGGCWTDGYSLGMLSAAIDADLMNASSWTKSPEPVFRQNSAGGAFGPGHNSFFQSKDGKEDWIIYHANPQPDQGCGGNRSIRIQPFQWDESGRPYFGEPYPLQSPLTKPSGEY